ncbi:MAG: PEP-CTERM sorting domain-containing protein [Rivularia sp. (in: cyanobacteria)]
MRINKLVSKLSVGVLLASVVTLAANPAYAAPKKDKQISTEQPTETQESTTPGEQGKDKQKNKQTSTEQPTETQENTTTIDSFSSCAKGGFAACTTSNLFNQDFLNDKDNNGLITVNEEGGFFDRTDWMFGGKIGSDAGYDGPQGGQSGSWDISKAMEDSWGDIMLVFKSGDNTNLVGYMLENGVKSGDWNSPYSKAVSHISVYYRKGKGEKVVKRKVPEPGSILGLVAVSGLVASSLKRKRKSSNIELV